MVKSLILCALTGHRRLLLELPVSLYNRIDSTHTHRAPLFLSSFYFPFCVWVTASGLGPLRFSSIRNSAHSVGSSFHSHLRSFPITRMRPEIKRHGGEE